MSTSNDNKMAWNATDELPPAAVERDDYLYEMVLKLNPKTSREFLETQLENGERYCIRALFSRQHPPSVSREYLRWMAGLNYFLRRFKGTEYEWPFAEEEPESHGEPYSLAYIEYWYDQTFASESAEKEKDPADLPSPRLVSEGVEPTGTEVLMKIWEKLMPERDLEGRRPFEIVVPLCRDVSKVLFNPDEENSVLAEVSSLLGLQIAVFCQFGGLLYPTTVFLGLRPGVDVSNLGTWVRFGWAWSVLLTFGERISNEDANILSAVQDAIQKDLVVGLNLGLYYGRYLKAKAKIQALDDERRQNVIESSRRSAKMALLCDAHHREMDRLAEEVSSKLLSEDKPFSWKAEKLKEFVEFGHPEIPLARPAARARVAERRAAALAVDLVKQIFQENTLKKQPELFRAFILEGDGRLPTLDDRMVRFGVVQDAWPPLAREKSKKAFKGCTTSLKRIRDELETLRAEEEDAEESAGDGDVDEDDHDSDSHSRPDLEGLGDPNSEDDQDQAHWEYGREDDGDWGNSFFPSPEQASPW